MNAKTIYTLLFSVIALMLVGVLTLDSAPIEIDPNPIVNLNIPPSNGPFTAEGITISNIDNVFTINGEYEGYQSALYINLYNDYMSSDDGYSTFTPFINNESETSFSFSTKYISGTVASVDAVKTAIKTGTQKYLVLATGVDDSASIYIVIGSNSYIYLFIPQNIDFDNFTFSLQLETGTVANDYVNYGIITTPTTTPIDTYTNKIISASGVIIGLVVLVTIVVPIISGKKEND